MGMFEWFKLATMRLEDTPIIWLWLQKESIVSLNGLSILRSILNGRYSVMVGNIRPILLWILKDKKGIDRCETKNY